MEIEQCRISKTDARPSMFHTYITVWSSLHDHMPLLLECWSASFQFSQKGPTLLCHISQVLLYIVLLSHLVQRKAPQTFTPIIFSHSAVSPSANLDTTLSIILSKNSQVNQGGLVFCSPVNGGNIGSIVHQDIDSLGKGFQCCVEKILNCSSICDVSFNHQGNAILLSNLELQFTQLFFGSDKKQKKGFLEFDQTYLATRTTSYLGTLQASCLAISAPKP